MQSTIDEHRLISDNYRLENIELHARRKDYGMKGHIFLDNVMYLVRKYQTNDILDYGCGKSTLANNLGFKINQYDPAIEKYSDMPFPADIVVCTDVLEHIEPDCLDNVLTHLASLMKKAGFFSIHLHEAKKTLPDGRNAHLCLLPANEWINKLSEKFKIIEHSITEDKKTLSMILEPLEVKNT